MSKLPQTDELGVPSSVAAARALFDRPKAPITYEPVGPDQCEAAVRTLAECFAAAGGTVADIVANARAAAQVLSGDRLQGLSEIVQNADDAGATSVSFIHDADTLLAVHNGRPLSLRDVHALAAPWLTTKSDDAAATGRFGIGLLTLHSLASAFELHGGDYHLRLGDPTLDPVAALPPHPAYTTSDTVLSLPLTEHALPAADLLAWSQAWDDSALLFLRTVRSVTFTTGSTSRSLRLGMRQLAPLTATVGGEPVDVQRQLRTAPDGRSWLVHTTETRSPTGLQRTHKKTEPTTPLGVALAMHENARAGHLHAGLPVVPTGLPLSVNAQFDPIASRQNIADSDWNRALTALVADLWVSAMLDVFSTAASSGWNLVPLNEHTDLPGPESGPIGALAQLASAVRHRAVQELPDRVRIAVGPGDNIPLAELAVESSALTGLISDIETAELADLPRTLSRLARDPAGRWRQVLTHWREQGSPLPDEVNVNEALPLTEVRARGVEANIKLTAAGVAAGLETLLNRLSCLVLEDGTHTRPPGENELRVLVQTQGGLGSVLGIADQLHPAYSRDSEASRSVCDWLRTRRQLADSTSDLTVLQLLASAGLRGAALERTVSDEQVRAIRDALEPLGHAEWDRLGAGIGAAIRLDVIRYDQRGKAQATSATPAQAYQPKAIDREPDSFAVAADTTPGLLWMAPRYATVLRSPHGRAGLGAQRFLRMLGAETAPRLSPHPRLNARYADPRRGLHIHFGGSAAERTAALQDLQATYSLDDMDCPDLEKVLKHIATDRKAQRRRLRASAVLAVLGRAWPSFGDHAQVPAARDYGGWRIQGTVRAWWLWTAGNIAWLDNAAAAPTAPARLRRRTAATVALHGNAADTFLHPAFASARSEVLVALGVAGEPATRELVRRLEQLRDAGPPTSTTASEAAIAYQALGERAGDRRRAAGHVAAPQLRQAFSAGAGLILTNQGWRPPAEVLRGQPVFGDLRPFVPQAPGSDPLWRTLQIRTPDLKDCVDVMREVARQPIDAVETQTLALDILRLMVTLLPEETTDDRVLARLRRLPVATSQGWSVERPVYCVEDPSLAEGIADRLPVWQPGGELSQFQPLVKHLKLTTLTARDVPLVEVENSYIDDDTTVLFQEALKLLREDLARNDPATERGARTAWPKLEALEVRIADSLRASLKPVTNTEDTVAVTARLDLDADALYLTDSEHLGRPSSGGRAIAGMFDTDHRGLAQAWLAAVTAAREGREGIRLQLAAERAAATEEATRQAMDERLRQLQNEAGEQPHRAPAKPARPRRGQQTKTTSGTPESTPPKSTKEPRVLVDLDDLVLVNPNGDLVPASAELRRPLRRRRTGGGGDLPPPRKGGAAPQARSATRDYSDLDKESLGLDLVRWVLASDEDTIVDLRAQHNVGADAVDLMRRFYELKVYAGAEPDEIVLEDAEIRRALSTPDFFLVVVSGLEGRTATPRVRVVANPLGQLRMSERSQIRFSGVRQSQCLVFNMRTQAREER